MALDFHGNDFDEMDEAEVDHIVAALKSDEPIDDLDRPDDPADPEEVARIITALKAEEHPDEPRGDRTA